ncbi:MAG: HmuY family protein [Gemmatimonadota bacterium]
MLPGLEGSGGRTPTWLWLAGGLFVAVIGLVVASSVSRPETPVFRPSSLEAREREVKPGLFGPDTVTLDARRDDRWTRFDLARGTVAGPGEPWDLAVKRYRLAVNGGDGFAGEGGARRLDAPFDAVREAPAAGYEPSRVSGGGDTVNSVLDGWYGYSLFSHLLEPEPATFVVRTHDGKYAKVGILGYYCPGPEAGCLTFEYVYQGDGSRRLAD